MAERRMFHTTVVESDAFLDLPPLAQVLYFHLGMHADDDGFINSPKQIARRMRIPVTKLQLLADAGFLLEFDGVVVLRHWRVANTLRKARLKPLQYPEIAQKLYIQSNGLYSVSPGEGSVSLWEERMSIGRPLDVHWMPKVRENKITDDNITENNINESKVAEGSITDTDSAVSSGDAAEIHSGSINRNQDVIRLTPAQVRNLVEEMGLDYFAFYVEKLTKFIYEKDANVKSHYATIRKWWKEDQGL